MAVSKHTSSAVARFLLAGMWGILCAMILAAPILASQNCDKAASVFYLSFSSFCHQIQERSFSISGHSLAVCHRCFGIYLGFFIGSLIHADLFYRSLRSRRICILAAGIPMMFDVFLSYTGIWSGTGISRFLTGLLFGSLISPLLVRGLSELLYERRMIGVLASHLKKGFS
jgi:uncharacterized membrane protein